VKLRWRLIIALAIAGILPLIPMMLVVRSAVELSASSLAPAEVAGALDSGVFLTRSLLAEIRDEMNRHLDRAIQTLPPPPSKPVRTGRFELHDGESLYVKSSSTWYRYAGGGWAVSTPPAPKEEEFGGIPQALGADSTVAGLSWHLFHPIPEEIRTQALALQRARSQWTLRSYERDRLLMSLVLTYLLAHLAIVGLAVGAALIVIVPVTRRIERLADVMDAVGEGRDLRAREEGGGEVRRLASTFNLMIDRLEQSRKRASEMERMAGWRELARVLAHEIKNPLTPIQLSVQQISDSYDGSDEQFSELLRTTREVVDEEVESLRKLVREFSDFAREPQLEIAAAAPKEIVDELSALYKERLDCVIEGSNAEIPVDREKLKRALLNLVENACQAAGDGQVRLTVREAGDVLRFIVEDSGPGVPAELGDAIFEPYQTTKSSGIGLGLPVVRNVARRHGGEIRMETSEALGGAKFILEIPSTGVVAHTAEPGAEGGGGLLADGGESV